LWRDGVTGVFQEQALETGMRRGDDRPPEGCIPDRLLKLEDLGGGTRSRARAG
jgi:hypothetical protein